MKQFTFLLLLVCLLGLMIVGCKVTGSHFKPGSATYVDLKSIKFTADEVSGQVQIKPNRTAPWHDLSVGETFDGYALVRSGYQSEALLTMRHGHRQVRCEMCALVCATSINDIYDRILSPEALAEYKENMWKKDDRLDLDAPICISREALKRFEVKETLLAATDGASLLKGGEEGSSSVPGAPGGGGGGAGAGGGGGGCAT